MDGPECHCGGGGFFGDQREMLDYSMGKAVHQDVCRRCSHGSQGSYCVTLISLM